MTPKAPPPARRMDLQSDRLWLRHYSRFKPNLRRSHAIEEVEIYPECSFGEPNLIAERLVHLRDNCAMKWGSSLFRQDA